MKISQILTKYDTDKHLNKKGGHCYGYAYDYLFSPYDREGDWDILEVGTYYGESLLAWREYFFNSKITGIDIEDLVDKKHPNINYIISDIADFTGTYDLVIDDGSHKFSDIKHTLKNIRLNPGGMMVIEDCQAPNHWYEWVSEITDYIPMGIDLRRVNGQGDDYLIVLRNYDSH